MAPENKNIVILGAGESGVGSAILAKQKGFSVFVSDKGKIADKYKDELNQNAIEWEDGQHTESRILEAKEIIKSPGIPEKAPVVAKAIQMGIPVISEIEFAGRYTNAYTVCITGSNGKTTTTLLAYDILKRAGLNVGLAGNVGHSFARQVAQENYDCYVLELSSFQLDGMYKFKADTAIILNITPDHLDRYNYDFERYVDSKFRIIQNQTSSQNLIFCADDEVIIKKLKQIKPNVELIPFSIEKEVKNGAYTEDNKIIFNAKNNFEMAINDLSLKGKHNAYNSMAAGLSANVLKIRKEHIRDSLSGFKGVEHRLEKVIDVHKIEFINDSKATNANSTRYALESMKKPVVWIAGGTDKGNDYQMLNILAKQKVHALVCLGEDNSKLHNAFENIIPTIVDTKNMDDAVKTAYYLAQDNDVVLLSPACASFDLFKNYEDRGCQFKEAVRNL